MRAPTLVRGGALAAGAAIVAALALPTATGCGPFCRDIATRELAIRCQDGPNRFTGELHFDRAATYETFLSQQCLPDASEGAIAALVQQVDFTREAVFVAAGPANLNSRCVEDRSLDKAQVCTDGLKVYFADQYASSDEGCAGPRWTVAFALAREDLRAALEAGEAADNQTAL